MLDNVDKKHVDDNTKIIRFVDKDGAEKSIGKIYDNELHFMFH